MPSFDIPPSFKILGATRFRCLAYWNVDENWRELNAQLVAHARISLKELGEHAVVEPPRSWVLQRFIYAITQGAKPGRDLRGIHLCVRNKPSCFRLRLAFITSKGEFLRVLPQQALTLEGEMLPLEANFCMKFAAPASVWRCDSGHSSLVSGFSETRMPSSSLYSQ